MNIELGDVIVFRWFNGTRTDVVTKLASRRVFFKDGHTDSENVVCVIKTGYAALEAECRWAMEQLAGNYTDRFDAIHNRAESWLQAHLQEPKHE